uniref:Uncharacterized protein n=1 Tax=Rhizophora mucronata TaxID=61149 RepID=A0A2P2Q927_RHIMU
MYTNQEFNIVTNQCLYNPIFEMT